MARTSPYGSYNFLVAFGGPHPPQDPMGGFSDVSGLSTEMTVAEYRNGNDVENHVRKVPGVHKVGDVTLKRGILKRTDFWDWIDQVRLQGVEGQRQVSITLNDEAGQPVQTWTLQKCIPLKWTGPTLAAKGGGDVAMEELTLSCEGLVLAR